MIEPESPRESPIRRVHLLAGVTGLCSSILLTLCAYVSAQPAVVQTVPIFDIQGNERASPFEGEVVTVRGVVTADFQSPEELGGFFVQERTGDGDQATSDAIFVYHHESDVEVGDEVEILATVKEHYGLTELTDVQELRRLGVANLPGPVPVNLPLPVGQDWESLEGMLLTVGAADGELTVTETFHLGRGGLLMLADERLIQYTEMELPSKEGFRENQEALERSTLLVDDGSLEQNPDPIRFSTTGNELTAENTVRLGDTVSTVTGVLSYSFNGWSGTDSFRLHATSPVDFAPANPRPLESPEVGGRLRVASFNVLNLFNGDGRGNGFPTSRGADTPQELRRQLDKLVTAMLTLDAHVLGLVEIENDEAGPNSATATLVEALNARAGADIYDYIETGRLGDDEIKQAFVYQPAVVAPTGGYRVLGSGDRGEQYSSDERFDGSLNRPALAQTFSEVDSGESFTVIVNHLKSKGQHCIRVADYDSGDGQGNCNGVRADAARALADWSRELASESGDPDVLILGDLNAYRMEDPIRVLLDSGFHDLLPNDSYSYVYFGAAGTLDHALANGELVRQVTGAGVWHINADEPAVLDYNTDFKSDRHIELLFDRSPYRSSDHDPLVVGLDLGAEPDSHEPDGTRSGRLGSFVSERGELVVGEVTRSYTLFAPEQPGDGQPPLVTALHGRGGNGEQMADATGLGEHLSVGGALVVFPDGLDGQWNYLGGLGGNDGVDDVRFLEELARSIASTRNVDSQRLHVIGFSNGGFMAQRLACEPRSPFAAFAVVAAAGFGGMPELCRETRPISVLLIHGTADNAVPWDGQVSALAGRELLLSASVPQTFAFWTAFAGCGGETSRRTIPQAGHSPGTRVEVLEVIDCPGEEQVSLYAVVNGGHTWPGRPAVNPVGGPLNMDIDAGETAWEFFRQVEGAQN